MNILKKITNFFSADEKNDEKRHELNEEILREYDIRGIFGKNLLTSDARNIGKAFGTVLIRKNLKKICVGRDCRISSNILFDELISGLVSTGVEVTSLDICHTPLVYYCVHKLNLDGGVMVTGSHNPPEYNGFKFVISVDPFYGDEIRLLGTMIKEKDFVKGTGREIVRNNISSMYVKDILKDFNFKDENLKIAWDIGNGATSNIIKTLTNIIPGKHHLLFEEMDGNFPNRPPDPVSRKNIEYLCKFVSYNNFDIGFGFDSDGDRLAVVNANGELLYSDQVLSVFAEDFLKKNPAAQVIADVKSCNSLFETIRRLGGIGIMERVGHSFIKARMKATGTLLAGEMSGHFFFKDRWFGFDDGIYAALRCLEIISKDKDAFNNLEYGIVTPEIRIDCENDFQKFEIIKFVKNKLKEENISFSEIDGVRASLDIGWWVLRASNTQEALSLRIEAYSEENMKILKEKIMTYLSDYLDINELKKLFYEA